MSATNSVFGDPCRGTFKRLSIIYACSGDLKHGLLGTYFDNRDFTGQVLERVDPAVDFAWGSGSPDAAIGSDTFSVRWTGYVNPEFSEPYTFYTVSDDGVRLWVDGQLIIDNWTDHPPTENRGTLALQAGTSYPIKMEFYENGGGAVAKLLWSSPSREKQVIPAARFPAKAGTIQASQGVQSTMTAGLPGGEPTACEWEWTIRTLHYHPGAVVPRRMYSASCTANGTPRMLTSLTVGRNAPHPTVDPSSGGIVVSELDALSGKLNVVDQAHFPACLSMHGIAVSDDCSTIGVLCRVPSGTTGFDKDVLTTHKAAAWMTQPYVCGGRPNDEMWLFEWTNGDIHGTPKKYIVHRAIGSWEYGNNYLRLGDDGNTWGIALKTTVGGQDGAGCHEADAFLVMDRQTATMTHRGWSWACGTGHTTFNRPAYNPRTKKYALMCSTDYNKAGTGGIGAYVFRMEKGAAQEFHYLNVQGIKNKGGASALVPRADGGFLGVLVGTEGQAVPLGYPTGPPTAIGLGRWSAEGQMEGPINWVVKDDTAYLSYSNLVALAPDRYLLGWGVMRRMSEPDGAKGEISMRIPWEYHVMEIDGAGNRLTEPLLLEGAGWGELDEMVPLGHGRAGWAYIAKPALRRDAKYPSCNQANLQLSVYASPNGG